MNKRVCVGGACLTDYLLIVRQRDLNMGEENQDGRQTDEKRHKHITAHYCDIRWTGLIKRHLL